MYCLKDYIVAFMILYTCTEITLDMTKYLLAVLFSVESNFNIIKNILLNTEKILMRADEFVTKHVNFMSGCLKIAHTNTQDSDLRDTRIEKNICPNQNDNGIVRENNVKNEKKMSSL